MYTVKFSPVCRQIRRAAALAVALALPATALADSSWKSAGSTGTVDDGCISTVRLASDDARLAPGTSPMSCTIRYQVLDTFGGPPSVGSLFLAARFTDNGPLARVEVRLRSQRVTNGALATVATLNSDTFPASSVSQYRSATGCFVLNFFTHTYWVEVNLTRYASPTPTVQGTPVIRLVSTEYCLI